MNGHTTTNSSANIDFDRAFTFGSYPCPDGGKRLDLTSFSMFEKYRDIDPVFLAEIDALYKKYISIENELDGKMDPLDKAEKMLEWPVAVYKLYGEYITKDILDDALEGISSKLKIREGMKDFVEFFISHNMPVLIYSAGISNVIHAVLKENNLSEDISIHGNILKFNDKGEFIVPKKSDIIYTENKVWRTVPEDVKRKFEGRTHMIVMGDSTGDARMGAEHMELHKIGFQLEANKNPEGFRALFNEVIKSEECDRGYLKKVTSRIISES